MEGWSRDDDDMKMAQKEQWKQQRTSVEPTQAHVSELRNPNIVKNRVQIREWTMCY
jgi:hypothetical protein